MWFGRMGLRETACGCAASSATMRGAAREHTSYANLSEARVVHSDYGASARLGAVCPRAINASAPAQAPPCALPPLPSKHSSARPTDGDASLPAPPPRP